jgi:isocitrate lyase
MDSRPAGQYGQRNQEGVIKMGAIGEQAALLQQEWETDPRWAGITRDYSARDVIRLRGRVAEEPSLARRGASRLWDLLHGRDAVRALGAITGNQAVQLLTAGPQAIYLPGCQAADWHRAEHARPDRSLRSVNSVSQTVRRISDALRRADQAAEAGTLDGRRRLPPVVADAEAGFGAVLDAFDLMKAMIEAGAAGVRFGDEPSPDKKRGHLSGKVLIPTGQHIETLTAARLAADVLDVPALVIARTGAQAASLLTSDSDERDHEFLTGERTADGFYRVEPGLYACITRALAYAPYADLLWFEASSPDLAEARAFAGIVHSQYPDKLLAYSCPSFNWGARLDDPSTAEFREELAAVGYRFQFTDPAESHALDESTSEFADRHAYNSVPAYAQV